MTKLNISSDFFADKARRNQLIADPKQFVKQHLGYDVDDNIEIKILRNTKHITYVPIPRPEGELSQQKLADIQGAGSISTAGTAACLGSISSMCSSASTFATASSAGSLGSH